MTQESILSFDATTFRRTLGMFATGIAVITARSRAGEPIGLTISSFNSVSLDPPLIVWSLSNHSSLRDELECCEHYAINVLAADQEEISNRFASRSGGKFAGLVWDEGLGGVPLLADCCAVFEVRNTQRLPGGDHLVFISEVLRCEKSEKTPLVFFGGRYRTLAPESPN